MMDTEEHRYSDKNPHPAEHDVACIDWCNHCALCGDPIMWGARCNAHLGIYPKEEA